VIHIQTTNRGHKQNTCRFQLDDFTIWFDQNGRPLAISCPRGQTFSFDPSLHKKAFIAHFAAEACVKCPLVDKCPEQPRKCYPDYQLSFAKDKTQIAKRRRLSRELNQEGCNLREAVKATLRSIKHPFPAGKLTGEVNSG